MKKVLFIPLLISTLTLGQKFTKSEISRITNGSIETALHIFQTSDSLQNKILLNQSVPVKPNGHYTKILINRMKLALLSTQGGVGIAAPQVGINRNIVLAKRFDKEENPLEHFLNPKILWRSEILNLGPEGDLSMDVFRDTFYRSHVIQLEYYTVEGKKITEIVEGFTAVILQHEIDHLSGILISDKIKDQKTKNFEKVEFYQLIP
jgi:peptide deformylase